MPANLYEYSLLCRMATYRESRYLRELSQNLESKTIHENHETFLRNSGWQPLRTSEEFGISAHGYFGVAYYKIDPLTNQVEVAIAHRGTCFNASTIGNVLADIEIADRKPPKIIDEAAMQYLGKLYSSFRYDPATQKSYILIQKFDVRNQTYYWDECEISRFTHTGFSLGGFIAGACTAQSPLENTYAVTFDAPGIDVEAMSFDRVQKARKIRNIVTKPNLVNTCNPQVGEVEQLVTFAQSVAEAKAAEAKEEKISFDLEIADLGFGNTPRHPGHYADPEELEEWREKKRRKKERAQSTLVATEQLTETIKSHNLDKIILALSKVPIESQLRKVHRWPHAANILKRGPKPFPGAERFFGNASFLALLLDVAATGVQIAKGSAVATLWELTKSIDPRGQEIGIIGIQHERTDQIVYEDEHQIAQFTKMLEALEVFLKQLERHDSKQATPAAASEAPVVQRASPLISSPLASSQIRFDSARDEMKAASPVVHSQREVKQSEISRRASSSQTSADLLSQRDTVYNSSSRTARRSLQRKGKDRETSHSFEDKDHSVCNSHHPRPVLRNG